MNHGNYIDFENEKQNTYYNFRLLESGELVFDKLHGRHIVSGDSDSVYSKLPEELTKNKPIEEIIGMCDAVADYVNHVYPAFLEATFNCPIDRNWTMNSEREVVSDKSLFMTKKRYIMHVINNEGMTIDKWKVSGLEVKKADTPPAVKKFLYDLLIYLVEGLDINDVEDKIAEFKEDYFTMDITQIGVPKPAKSLYKYEKAIEASGGYMKGVPYHVKAAINYNSRCGTSDKIILPGEKFYLSYTKNIHYNLIAYPIDMQQDPEWWDEVILDYDLMWEKAYKKIYNYLNSVDLTPTGRRKTKSKDLFGM